MNDIIIEGLSTVLSLAIGGLIGYVVAYVTGLKAIRKGMQLILRATVKEDESVQTFLVGRVISDDVLFSVTGFFDNERATAIALQAIASAEAIG